MTGEDGGKASRYALSCILWALTVLICLAGSVGAEPKPVRFGIYLLKRYADRGAVEELPLADLVLEDKPLLTQDDLLSYDRDTHTLQIRPGITSARLRTPGPQSAHFVVVADGRPAYLGVFTTMASSRAPRVPFCSLGPRMRRDGRLPEKLQSPSLARSR
jgi:hypothetical protein